MVKGWPVRSWRTLLIRMLGEVPTRVTMPPTSEPNAIGISSLDGELPVRRASCMATGMKIASAPTFLVTMDSSVVATTRAGTCRASVFRWGSSGRISSSTTPDRAIAELTTRAQATMMTTSSAKPWNAWAGLTMPQSTLASKAMSATRS